MDKLWISTQIHEFANNVCVIFDLLATFHSVSFKNWVFFFGGVGKLCDINF